MSLADAFKTIALGFSELQGAPYHDGVVSWPTPPTVDTGGSISAPSTPTTSACSVQVSEPTEQMRLEDDFQQTDVRLLILRSTVTGTLDTTATVTVSAGPHAGTYAVKSVTGDGAGIGWSCRGRKVA